MNSADELKLVLILTWSLFWKGLALWRAAKRDHKIFYVALLVINTLGIFEIFYYFWVSKWDWVKIQKDMDKRLPFIKNITSKLASKKK